MFRQSNSPTYNNKTRNNNNNNNRRDNYNRGNGNNNYRRNGRNNQNYSSRYAGSRTETKQDADGWETVSRSSNTKQSSFQNRPRQSRQPTNSRFNSLKSSPVSRSYKNTKPNSFSALDDTSNETRRPRWENPKSELRPKQQYQLHQHNQAQQHKHQMYKQQQQQQKPAEPVMEFPPLSATSAEVKPTPKPSLQGAWGKKLSDAVVTEEKFEKQVIKPKENDGMVAINLKNKNSVQKSSYRKFNYKNQYNPQLFNLNTSTSSSPKLWGDYEDEEESQYYEDSYSDDDGGRDSRDNASVSDEEEYYSDDYDYRY